MIKELFAFVVLKEATGEHVLRRPISAGTHPLIADSLEHLEWLRADAERAAAALQLPFFIARFVRDEGPIDMASKTEITDSATK
jgi:hypothetical protein